MNNTEIGGSKLTTVLNIEYLCIFIESAHKLYKERHINQEKSTNKTRSSRNC